MSLFTEILTKRLRLRKLTHSDWEAISFLRSDPDVNKFVKRAPAETQEKALAFIAKICQAIETNSSLYWVITEQGHNQMIGSICLWNFSEDRKKAEVGYDLHPNSQGKGIMNEALKAIINFGFNSINLKSIEAYTQKNNTASINLLECHGFKLVVGKQDADNLKNAIYALRQP
ncbi:GNAT family N-acetyltransferase [Bizionia sp. M204]|uniref:GNAT family N-acetyltransferase n=1 Tax=unclassified Bizionia TaxID=2626393 RepID=UPI002047A6D0|nr:GNAT family N-acetyltransferase [Bizionia sp. M204]UPS91946.1 GNAT family N-acetyltransferase [Bizionia sp. M204]